mmetsp:Transcript_33803/g.54256  ORF Transcript_33803/g.54256 Transcript_33803/m.54256 type:complete len:121 (-) Transcript_33803:121-483(-)
MAMPPWRMRTAASATTEVTSRGDGWGVKNSRIIKRIHHILLSADFNVISAKIVREMLEADLNVDLSARRTLIIDTVLAFPMGDCAQRARLARIAKLNKVNTCTKNRPKCASGARVRSVRR